MMLPLASKETWLKPVLLVLSPMLLPTWSLAF
jgi:hypothetical protein